MASKEKITLIPTGEYLRYWIRQVDRLSDEWREELLHLGQELPSENFIHYSNPLSVIEADEYLKIARDKNQQIEVWLSDFKSASKNKTVTPFLAAQREIKIKERDFWVSVIRQLKLYRSKELQKQDNEIPMSDIEMLSRANRRNLAAALEILGRYIYLEGISAEDLEAYLEIKRFYDSTRIPKGSVIKRDMD